MITEIEITSELTSDRDNKWLSSMIVIVSILRSDNMDRPIIVFYLSVIYLTFV